MRKDLYTVRARFTYTLTRRYNAIILDKIIVA